jgi:ribonuclease BN (tRNA processing enzyme)
VTIEFLKVLHGDSILIRFSDKNNINRNILIDGGPRIAYLFNDRRNNREKAGELKVKLTEIKGLGEKIDLLIITHVDDDHIGGILRWIEDNSFFSKDDIGKIWFNSGLLIAEFFQSLFYQENLIPLSTKADLNTSIKQGATLEQYIKETQFWDRKIIKAKDEFHELGMTFKILSPEIKNLKLLLGKWEKEVKIPYTYKEQNDYHLSLKEHIKRDNSIERDMSEDNAKHNGSSIAFILSYENSNFLFLADAHHKVVEESLRLLGYSETRKLKAKMVKVSHHGSKSNTSKELLSLIDCDYFVISSNGDIHSLPDKLCLSRIIASNQNATILINYSNIIDNIFSKQDYIDFPNMKVIEAKTKTKF